MRISDWSADVCSSDLARGDTVMLDWNDYRDELKTRIREVGKLSPDTVRGYATLSGAGPKTGHLDAKTRELIALAVAVTTRHDGRLHVHVDGALKRGRTAESLVGKTCGRTGRSPWWPYT